MRLTDPNCNAYFQKVQSWYYSNRAIEEISSTALYKKVHKALLAVRLDEPITEETFRDLLAEIEGRLPNDADWFKQGAVQVFLGLNHSKQVTDLIEDGELKTNGKSGKAKRIDPMSFAAYCRRKGLPRKLPE